MFGSSPLDVFSSSSKAKPAEGTTANAAAPAPDVECPEVTVRAGAATLSISSKPKEGEPAALDLRYQGTIVRTARECVVNSGMMIMKVGIEGRVITGPSGGPGPVQVPLRIAVVQEGVNPVTVFSRFAPLQVEVTANVDRVTFTHVDPAVTFPLPQRLADIDSYVVYVGFDSIAAEPKVKKKPPGKPVARKKPAPKPSQS